MNTDDWDPIENHLGARMKVFLEQYMKLMLKLAKWSEILNLEVVQAHEKIFGKPVRRRMAGSKNRIFSIWEINDDTTFNVAWYAEVWVHNINGVSFQVYQNCTGKMAWTLWQAYRLAVQLHIRKNS